ncbi:Uncharacterised protein [Buttiauxella agrestis]|uniref:Uncharacterized protein n=1 Tax=Buttiauxella agrestis TaxID=82977 RepID=A0A381CD35_9ENTR|nr:Uncharacterised protein [Buttiauxella agrestis]
MKKFMKQFIFDWIKTETLYSYFPLAIIIILSCAFYRYFPEHWGKLTFLSIFIVIVAVWKIAKRIEK